MSKEKKPLYVTDVREACWIWLHEPDSRPYKGKPVPPRYRVSLLFDGKSPEWKTFQKQLDAWVDASVETFVAENPHKRNRIVRREPYHPQIDQNNKETGAYIVTFKRRATFKDKNTGKEIAVRVPLFDTKGAPLPEGQVIGNGSRLRVSYTVRPYATDLICGVTLDIKAVMAHELHDRPALDAQSYGFDVEDPEIDEAEGRYDAAVF